MAARGKKAVAQISMERLAAVAGTPSPAFAQGSSGVTDGVVRRTVCPEPDISRIRRNSIDETPEDRKLRLAAKTVNFTATIIARIIILAAGGLYVWNTYEYSGQIHRGFAIGLFAMTADLGRVTLKALEPGSR